MTNILFKSVVFYKKISGAMRDLRIPLVFYTDCKFYPTCSDYAIHSINKYGIIKGIAKSLTRVFRCSPFHKGGVDMP